MDYFKTIAHADKVKIYRDKDTIIIDVDGFVLAVVHADEIDIEEKNSEKQIHSET